MSGLEKMEARLNFLEQFQQVKKDEVDVKEQAAPAKSEYFCLYKKISWCPTTGCPNTFRYKYDRHYHCEMCKQDYCLDCRSPYHKNTSEGGYDCSIWQKKRA
jgi:IBR domain, a half RING-finger domain